MSVEQPEMAVVVSWTLKEKNGIIKEYHVTYKRRWELRNQDSCHQGNGNKVWFKGWKNLSIAGRNILLLIRVNNQFIISFRKKKVCLKQLKKKVLTIQE